MVGYMNFNQGTSDITGFKQDNREFAVVGLVEDAAAFVDITDPGNPFEVGRISGTPNIWRDLKYWNRHVYIGTEAQDGVSVISVDDPDNPILVHTISDFTNSHNIHIDTDGFLYVVGAEVHDIWIYELTDHPENPVLIGTWDGEYFHDIEVYNNKLYGAAIEVGLFYILDVSDKTNPTILISHDTGIEFGTHDCAVTENENYLIIADEKTSGHISIWDISDYENINRVSEYFVGINHSVHNVYVRPGTNLAIISYYVDGTRVLDISDPTNPIEVGYFDTSTLTGLFDGNWGTYAYLPSGYIISSDRATGLYILESPLLTNSSMGWSDCTDIVGDNLTCYGDIYKVESEVVQEIINLNTELAGLEIEDISSFSAGRVLSIDLSSRGLTSLALPDDIGMLTNIEILKLNNNNMLSLPSTLCDFPDDCIIDVTGNRLCPDFIEPFENCISTLSYQNCDECESGYWFENFCSDSTDVGVLWDLIGVNDTLNGYNPMEIGNIQIGSPIWQQGKLIYLNLSNYNLTSLPENIGNLNNLKELDLKNNSIGVLPDNITFLDSLLILRLHNNLLSKLPAEIGNLINLEELYLSGNQLTLIPESIGSLQNIQKLFLSDNQLTSLPSTICDLPEDCNIQLKNNCIAETYECIPDLSDQNVEDCAGQCGGEAELDCSGFCGGDDISCLAINELTIPEFRIYNIHPNPFNPTTRILLSIDEYGFTTITAYDITGKKVETIINEVLKTGFHTISWNASSYPAGLYFIRIDSEGVTQTQKVVLLK